MDKELAQLEQWGVDLINNYEESLRKAGVKPSGPGGSEFKRIGRFSGELVANPEAYGELLEMARSKNMTGKQLVAAIRKIEQSLLDESSRGTKTSRKLLMSDVIHHFYAQRTGGDTLRRLAQSERGEARKILRDAFGRWGNVPENLLSIYRAWHQDVDPLKGVEAAAMAPEGITKAGQLGTSKFHATRSTSPLITSTVEATTAQEAVEGMTPMFERQQKEGLAALGELQILRNQLSERLGLEIIDPRTLSTVELAAVRNIYDANSELVERTIRENLNNYIIDGGTIRSAVGSVAQAENFLKALRDNLPGESAGALFGLLLDPQMREAVEQGDSSKVGNILATDVGLGGLANIVSDKLMKLLPVDTLAKVAPILKSGATAMNVAAPVAAVSQIEGSVDPTVTRRKSVERLEQGSQADIRRKQYVPQEYGAAGPQMDPTTGQVITEPEPFITPEKFKQGTQMILNTIGGALKLMPSGIGF
jgi:hypothetical protein